MSNHDEMAAENLSLRYYVRMDLLEKIRKIEALIASSKSSGERLAAELAKNRILERQQQEIAAKPIEYKVSLDNPWKKKLLIALCNKHQIRTYRYKGQKYTTVRFRAISSFVDTILLPEYRKYEGLLEGLVQDIFTDLIDQIHKVMEDEVVIAGELPADL
jgi:hypothetical protein